MVKIFVEKTAQDFNVARGRETTGEALIRLGALAALLVEGCLVGIGIVTAIMGV